MPMTKKERESYELMQLEVTLHLLQLDRRIEL